MNNDNSKILLNKNEYYIYELNKFFKKCSTEQIVKINNIINRTSKISLRMIEWFVSKYSQQNTTLIKDNDGLFINIYNSYKAKTKLLEKKYFDPFKRYDIIEYTFSNNETIKTTISQLNFFKWIFENNILDYIEINYIELNKEMSIYNIYNTQQKINKKKIIEIKQNDISSLKIKNNEIKSNKNMMSLTSTDKSLFTIQIK